MQVLQQEVRIDLDPLGLITGVCIGKVVCKYEMPKEPRREQWDVRPIEESVFVTSHVADGLSHACLQQYTRCGRLVRTIKSEHFSEPNMLAVDY